MQKKEDPMQQEVKEVDSFPDGAKPYQSHPFKSMEVGKIVCVDKSLQKYVHTYGSLSGKKFSTRTFDGELYVERIE